MGKSLAIPVSEYYKEGLSNLFIEVCKLVELSKSQHQDNLRTLLVVEINKLADAYKGKFAEVASEIFPAALQKVCFT